MARRGTPTASPRAQGSPHGAGRKEKRPLPAAFFHDAMGDYFVTLEYEQDFTWPTTGSPNTALVQATGPVTTFEV